MRVRWITIAVDGGLFVVLAPRASLVPRQFFPSSDRPELLVDLQLPQNASIYASERSGGQARCDRSKGSRRRALEHVCRARRDPVLSAAQRRSSPTISSASS